MQFSPSNKIYAQAMEKLRALTQKYSTSKTRDADQISAEVNATLKEIADQVNGPTLKYKPIEFGEAPNSFKMNEFLQSLAFDVNVIMDEMNIVRAASVATHNFIKTELLKAELENARLHNKIKTLQLYSSSEDSSVLYIGDYFYNDEYIDWSLVPVGQRVDLVAGGYVSLGVSSQIQILSASSDVKIEYGSNGFVGNNQEAIASEAGNIFFSKEGVEESISTQLYKIIDQKPNTFFEFEKYFVTEADRARAKNYNFQYQYTDNENFKYLETLANQDGELAWGNSNDDLKLNLIIDIGKSERLSLVKFTPFGLTDNRNSPILIKSVYVSRDKTNWITLEPQNIWVANGIDQNTVNLDGENIVINHASFKVDGTAVRYLKLEMIQKTPLNTKIGHFYYIKQEDAENQTLVEPERFEGPVPPVDRIWTEKDPYSSYQNNLVQKRELFNGKRWAIGIRDIAAYTTQYNETSVLVSKRFNVPAGVDRVALEADVHLPDGFSTEIAWVRFYISPDDGKTWTQISRIQDDYLGIPEIIAYNDNTPVELRLPGVKYVETNESAKFIRLKIEIDRPTGDNTLTPTVKSYRLKIKQRVAL
jgi:hypothetical protein